METNKFIPNYLKEDAEVIHDRILSKAPPDINTIEGDFFWDITRPVSEELGEYTQLKLQNIIQVPFVSYSYGEYLDLKGEEERVFRKPPLRALGIIKIKGKTGVVIQKGKKVGTIATDEKESIEYELLETKVINDTGAAYIKAQCLREGTIGNMGKGYINVLITPINGVESVVNEEDFKNGIDKENDDDYRQRILEKKRTPITSGNKYHYRNWAKEVPGIGDAKVNPLWKGPGTVKVVIIDANKKTASKELIDTVFNNIEENRPIGATVTVVSAKEKTIDVTAKLKLANGFNIGQVQQEFLKLLDKYLKDIAFKLTYISIARIGNLLLGTLGVLDYTDLKINNSTVNLGLEDEEIPVLGHVELEV
ncbi:baseplate J/gp47 family protein [Clostridium tetani]|uniref:Baseplate J/gp47 family protein n=1 Tax=Clostridium tetani TaxID=1513 RepID=A0ABC8ECN5_CLOTA|nr:baseplate J/gp47 family protein [Clostridium tetani]BDR81012.1 hypothetical protein K234311028_12580 [Clostridium tetani]